MEGVDGDHWGQGQEHHAGQWEGKLQPAQEKGSASEGAWASERRNRVCVDDPAGSRSCQMKSAAKTEYKPHQQRDTAVGMGARLIYGGVLPVVSTGLSEDQRSTP